MITGNSEEEYSAYVVGKYLNNKNNLKLLSPGCGTGVKEIKFSYFKNFSTIEAFDLSTQRISFAKKNAEEIGIKNIVFFVSDVESFNFEKNKYDVVLFDSFLHHIKNLDDVLTKVHLSLKEDGILIISNEYVGPSRFQWSNEQLKISNNTLRNLPTSFTKRWQNNSVKTRIYRPGVLRMIMSDPSESVNSENILPEIHKRFKILEEKSIGGNILHLVLKDISHNFVSGSEESIQLLQRLFKIEDEFLAAGNKSDFIFGVYSK